MNDGKAPERYHHQRDALDLLEEVLKCVPPLSYVCLIAINSFMVVINAPLLAYNLYTGSSIAWINSGCIVVSVGIGLHCKRHLDKLRAKQL